MTTTLREVLVRRADDAGRPNLDLADLVDLGEARLRRRRLLAGVGGATAVVVAAGFVVGVALIGPVTRGDGPPAGSPSPTVNSPSTSPSPTEALAADVRQLFYVDVARQPPHEGTFHFGDRAIPSDNAYVLTDVTDDGFVYTSRDDLWFSDGVSSVQIGAGVCGIPPNEGISHESAGAVITGDAGSLVAWFECAVPMGSESPQSQTLVVYDTGSRREVVREPCATVAGCSLDAVIGEHIYGGFNAGTRSERPFIYDVNTATWIPATPRSYEDEVRNNPRGLMFGDTWETATGDEFNGWEVVGTRLVPTVRDGAEDNRRTKAFNTATHQEVQLRLPPGYHPTAAGFGIFEWLDDDTVALTSGQNGESGDIIMCQLSDGRCQLAVKAGPDDMARLLPAHGLPG